MTPQHRAIWANMPDDARRRAKAAAEFMGGIENAIDLWECARLNDERGVTYEADTATEEEQDALDELMVTRVCSGEYGPEAKRAVEEVVSSGRWGDHRATLRAARKAAWQVRNGGRGVVVKGRAA